MARPHSPTLSRSYSRPSHERDVEVIKLGFQRAMEPSVNSWLRCRADRFLGVAGRVRQLNAVISRLVFFMVSPYPGDVSSEQLGVSRQHLVDLRNQD